jgi:hypothetical protein
VINIRPRSAALFEQPSRQCSSALHAADAVRLRLWDEYAKVALSHSVTTEAMVMELARLMEAVFEHHG